eukprot:scaffold52341_cov51-Attheya_sp.AAC.1
MKATNTSRPRPFLYFALLLTVIIICNVKADQNKSKEAPPCDMTNNIENSHVNKPNMELPNELIEWIKSQSGAFINNKQEFRLQDPLDPTSGTGIFAVERIEKGEILCKIPENLMIQPDNDYDHNDFNVPNCGTVWALIHEIELGDESRFAPYVRYLLTRPRGQIPETWSDAGYATLREIYSGEDPDHWLDTDFMETWHEECEQGGSKDNPLFNHMAMQVVQRSEDELMIPFYDMYNHRNGYWLNTRQTFPDDNDSLEISARRTIEAGEQIYNSYNMCDECNGRKEDFFDSAQILTNYGFVEQMPQRWNFFGETAVFDLDEKKGDPGTIEFTWAATPSLNPAMLEFMEEEINRLDYLEWSFQEDKETSSLRTLIPDIEWNVIMQYHSAYRAALGYGLRATAEHLFKEWGANEDGSEAGEESEDE